MAVARSKKAPSPASRPRAKPKSRKKKKPAEPSGIWHWKTPDESSKLRFALGLVVVLLTAVTMASGEVRSCHDGTWRAGFRNLQGQFVLGLEWSRGEWPRRWVAH